MNSVNLIGRATRNPEVRETTSGIKVAVTGIAVDGANDSVSFIPVVCYGGCADIMANYVRKGNLIGVSGRLNQRAYKNSEGKEKSVIEVICDNLQLCEKKPTEEAKPKAKKKA